MTPAGQGALVVTAVATDTAGNSASTSTTLTVDTTAPAVAITSPGGPVNQPAQTITGTGEAGTTVTLFDNGSTTALGTTIVQSDGSWSTGVTLTAGTNSLTATDTDAAGNIGSTSSALIYTLNTTAPTGGTPALVAASDSGSSSIDNITDVTAPTFTVTLGATVVAGDTVQLLLGGAPLAHPVTHIITAADVTAGRVSLSVVAGDLGVDGTKLVSAQLSDSFGNSSTTAALSITLDTTAPAVAITTIEGGDNIINAAEAAGGIQISGTAEIGSSLTVNGAAVTVDGTGHWTTSVTPAGQGALVVTAVATDTAGNSASTSTTLTVDTTAPAVAITSPGGPVNQPAQTITGTGEAGTTVTLFDNGSTTALGTTIVQSDGSWSTGVTLTAGTNSLTATDTDAAGNIGSTSSALIYTLNTTAPTGGTPALVAASDSGSSSIDNITDVTAPTFTVTLGATVVAGDTVQLLLGGAPLAHPVTHIITAADVTAGRVSLSVVAGDLGVDGTKLVSAQLSDSFGNSSTTAALSITLDTTAPAVAITTIEGGDNIINAAEAAGGIQISGTAEIGSSLTVNGAAVTVDGTGHWTTSVTPAGQGALVVTAVATDTAGNSASTSTTLTVDTTAPAVAITSPGGPVNQPAQTITGTGEAGTTVTLFDNGSTTALGTTIVQSDGSWSTGVTLTAGTNSLTATDTDAAGNIGSTSSALIYTLNTTAPTGGTPALVAASDSGSSSIDNITDVTAPTFTVTLGATVVAGDTVQLLLGGAPLAHPVTHIITAADVTAGRVSLSVVAGDLGVDGTKLVSAQLSDSFGNSSTTAALSITLDTTAPAVAITTIEGGDNIINAAEAAGGIQISGTAEIGSSLTVNGAAVTVDGTGHWTTSVTPAGQGALVVTAVATDTAGNSASTSTTLTVDTTAPAVAITTIEGGDNIINAAEAAGGIQISGTAEIGSSLTVNGAAVTVDGTGHWTTSVTPAGQGALVVTAVATDTAGNSASTSTTLTVDTTAPAVAITTIEGGDNIINAAEAAGGIQISGTAEIGSSLTVNGAAVTVDGTGHWATSVTPAGQGALVVTAVATDTAGNSASTSTTLTVDTTAPAVAITTIEGGDNIINAAEAAGGIQISGTAEIGSSLTVNGAAVTVDGTGHWTTSVTPAGQGALVVTAVATDTAGNSASTSTTLTVDTTAPAETLAITAIATDSGSSSSDFVTNDTTLTVSGTNGALAAGEKIQVSSDNGTTWTDVVQTGTTWSLVDATTHPASFTYRARIVDSAGNIGTTASQAITIDTAAPTETLAITAIASSSSPNDTTLTVTGTNGALSAGEKIQVSSDNGTSWTDVVQNSRTSWSLVDGTTHSGNFTYQARIVNTAGNIGTIASLAVLIATSGGTLSIGGSPAFVVEFTGTGGNLALGSSPGFTGTVNAVSTAHGPVAITGSGSVTSGTGDAIDLSATGGTQVNPANLSINLTGPITGAAGGIVATQNASGSLTITTTGPVIGQAGRGILAQQSVTGVGSILVNGSGNVTGIGSGFSGIVAQNLNTANSGDITVSQTGNIIGGRDGIRAQTNGDGNFTVTTPAHRNYHGNLALRNRSVFEWSEEAFPSRPLPAISSTPAASASTSTTRRHQSRKLAELHRVRFRSQPMALSIPVRGYTRQRQPTGRNSGGI